MAGAMLCLYLANQATHSSWTFFTIEKFQYTPAQIGLSLGFVGIMVALVQGWLIRIINPKLGLKRSIFWGLWLYALGFVLIAFAPNTLWLYIFIIPFSLGGIAGPSIQGVISNQVPANEQGELQGALTSLMSATAIIGPLIMTSLFSYFTGKHAPIYLPGSPFLMGTLLVLVSVYLVYRSFHKHSSTLKHNTDSENKNEEKTIGAEPELVLK